MRSVLLLVACFGFVLAARADTDHLRELAKNRTPIVIAVSGPEAEAVGKTLQETVRRNPDFGRRKPDEIALVPLRDLDARLAGEKGALTVVLLLVGKERGEAPLPAALLQKLPFALESVPSRDSRVQSVLESNRPSNLAFRIGLYAPDGARLRRLYEVFSQFRADGYRQLPFRRRFESVRLALFSAPEWKSALEGWGGKAGNEYWNDIVWFPLAARAGLTPEALAERTQVFFTERANTPLSALPAEVAKTIPADPPVKPTSVVVGAGVAAATGEPLLLLSAPSRRLLQTRIETWRNVEALREAPRAEVSDLSRVGVEPLLVAGGPTAIVEGIHAYLTQTLRERLGVQVEPRGSVLQKIEAEIAAQMARGAPDTRGVLQRSALSRYVWVFTITELSGRTEYRPEEKKRTAAPSPFRRTEPERPRRKKNEGDSEYERRLEEYRRSYRSWEKERSEWQESYRNAVCEWDLTVASESVARARGLLELIDTKASGGAVAVWSQSCEAESKGARLYRQQRATVRGHDNRPAPLPVPAALDSCPPELTAEALERGADEALAALRQNALLPEPGLALAAAPDPPAPPVAPSAERRAKVAEVSGKTVTLNIGTRHGVKPGDRFEVLIQFRETRDPDTGALLRVKVLESVVVVVGPVEENVCDCTPATPADAAKAAKVTVGMPARPAPR